MWHLSIKLHPSHTCNGVQNRWCIECNFQLLVYPPEIYRSTRDLMRCIACNFDGYKAQTDAIDARGCTGCNLEGYKSEVDAGWAQRSPPGWKTISQVISRATLCIAPGVRFWCCLCIMYREQALAGSWDFSGYWSCWKSRSCGFVGFFWSDFRWFWNIFFKYFNGTRDPPPLHVKCHFKFPFF